MREEDQRFLLSGVHNSISQLTVEDRIKQLLEECEGLAEHSQLLKQVRQQLVEDFDARLKKSRALQTDFQKHLENLKIRQGELWKYNDELQKYLHDT